MKIENVSFLTPAKEISNNKIILSRAYSKAFTLQDGSNIFASSHFGNRENQQDSIAITQNDNFTLLLVADGIGGMSKGEIASYTTAKIIKKWLDSEDKDELKNINSKNLEDVLNALVYLISTRIPPSSGSTLNMSIIGQKTTLIANIGDSRTYTIKQNKINLETTDDSLVFSKYNPQTSLERDNLRFHKLNHIITNSIAKKTFPNIKVTSINNDDYDIICHLTDGITDYLTEKEINLYSQMQNPANTLVRKCVNGLPIHNPVPKDQYNQIIYPGSDNTTALIYSKKLIK